MTKYLSTSCEISNKVADNTNTRAWNYLSNVNKTETLNFAIHQINKFIFK